MIAIRSLFDLVQNMAKKLRQLSDEALTLIARRFSALSDRTRLKLLRALFDGEQSVGALVTATNGTQANISRHLQTLTDAGILARRKKGLQVFYSISDPTIFDLCELVCGSLEKQHAQKIDELSGR